MSKVQGSPGPASLLWTLDLGLWTRLGRDIRDHRGRRELRRARARLGRRGFLFAGALLLRVQALQDRIGNPRGEEADRADGVVVARDHVVDQVRIAVGVHDRDDGDQQDVRLLYRDVLLLRVDDEQGIRTLVHLLDAGQIL